VDIGYIMLRLRTIICEPSHCPCGAFVDARGLHGLSYRGDKVRSTRHHSLNDLVTAVASDGEDGHSGVKGAVRPAQK